MSATPKSKYKPVKPYFDLVRSALGDSVDGEHFFDCVSENIVYEVRYDVPLMLKTSKNPDGTPIEVFDGFRKALAQNRAQFFLDVASGPFYGFNRPGAKVSQGIIQNWWRQGMMGSALAHYQGIKAFSETDQTDDLKAITVPTLVMQGDDDQVVPYKDASVLQAKLLKHGTLKIYPGFPHGMMTTNADVINADILAFIKGAAVRAA